MSLFEFSLKVVYASDEKLPYSHFSSAQKVAIVTIIAITALVSPLSANMYYPSIQKARDDLHTTQPAITWTVTAYLIVMAISPLIWSNLADHFGRKPVYALSMLIYTCGSIGCACSHTLTALIASRVVQSAGSSAVQGAGAGTISDIYPREQRGTALGIYYLGPLLGPCLGPVIGGYVGQTLGWRWVFWILTIWGGVMCLLAVFVLPETHRRLVSQKHEIQQVNIPPVLRLKDNNPLLDVATVRYPVVAFTLFYFAMIYGAYFTTLTGLPLAFENIYGLSQGLSGVGFLAVGTGNIVGSVCGGRVTDLMVRAGRRSAGAAAESGESSARPKAPPEARLNFVWFGGAISLSALLVSGWLIDKHMSLASVLIFQFFVGVGRAFTFQCLAGYLIDVFPTRSARITGVQNFWRSVWTAIIVQLFPTMLDSIGWGWSFTVMFFLALAGALLIQVVVLRGRELRERFGPTPEK
ncbi:MFS general substrate transporter [Martensiomyces pterosporus]|nr:MFS general substrate transporter [Martensiomyces pterosporus]